MGPRSELHLAFLSPAALSRVRLVPGSDCILGAISYLVILSSGSQGDGSLGVNKRPCRRQPFSDSSAASLSPTYTLARGAALQRSKWKVTRANSARVRIHLLSNINWYGLCPVSSSLFPCSISFPITRAHLQLSLLRDCGEATNYPLHMSFTIAVWRGYFCYIQVPFIQLPNMPGYISYPQESCLSCYY